jgi:hypothetical protein
VNVTEAGETRAQKRLPFTWIDATGRGRYGRPTIQSVAPYVPPASRSYNPIPIAFAAAACRLS